MGNHQYLHFMDILSYTLFANTLDGGHFIYPKNLLLRVILCRNSAKTFWKIKY